MAGEGRGTTLRPYLLPLFTDVLEGDSRKLVSTILHGTSWKVQKGPVRDISRVEADHNFLRCRIDMWVCA